MASASFNEEQTINASLGNQSTINSSLPPINYIPGYKEAEEQRRVNENERISNEEYRETYFQHIVDEYEGGSLSGATFIPAVSEEGIISWTNNHDLPNPTPRDITGPQGDKGDKGDTGATGQDGSDGADGFSPIITTSKVDKTTTITIVDAEGTKTATILDGEGSGDMLKSTYDTDGNGIVDNAEKVNNHSVESDVPANAVFTDTTYTAGTGIDITNNVISNTQTSAVWGSITGTLSNQTDLQTNLNTKQSKLVSGTNIKTINNTSLLGSGNISIAGNEVAISNTQPSSNDVKIWIDTGEVQNLGSELHVGSTIDSNVLTNILIGKNLFDINVVFNGYELNSSTGNMTANPLWYVSNYIMVKPNTKYTLSGNKTFGTSNVWYDENFTFISTTTTTIGTITSPNNAKYLRFNGRLDELNNNIQLEKGSTATAYEAYIVPSINVEGREIYNPTKLDNYSTGEVRIGTWIDGKPLYRKVIVETGPTVTTDGTNVNKNINISSLNCDVLLVKNAFVLQSDRYVPLFYMNDAMTSYAKVYPTTSSNLRLACSNTTYSEKPFYVIIEYTKTTD